MRVSFTALLLSTFVAASHAGAPPQHLVPAPLRPPLSEHLVLAAHAEGVQIYQCTAGADGSWQWTLLAPEATLRDKDGARVAQHSAGPSWTHKDGSAITGKVVAKSAAPDPDSIPWLLLTVTLRSGTGAFEHVTSVQRVHTHGGQAPPAADCVAAKSAARVSVPYQADYRFYAPAS
jgi:hypothetical protein